MLLIDIISINQGQKKTYSNLKFKCELCIYIYIYIYIERERESRYIEYE